MGLVSWNLVISICGGATCRLCPSKQHRSNLGSNVQSFLCPWLPGGSSTKRDLRRVHDSLGGPKAPAGPWHSHTNDSTLGFGNLSSEAHLRTTTLLKLPGGTKLPFNHSDFKNELLKKDLFFKELVTILKTLEKVQVENDCSIKSM